MLQILKENILKILFQYHHLIEIRAEQTIFQNIKTNIKVYTKNIDSVAKDKYENQYNNLTIINTDIFHDRFIIIDKKILYHCGSSFKDLGKKCFAITKIDDDIFIKELIDKLNKINIMQ